MSSNAEKTASSVEPPDIVNSQRAGAAFIAKENLKKIEETDGKEPVPPDIIELRYVMQNEMLASIHNIFDKLSVNASDQSVAEQISLEGLRLANFAKHLYTFEMVDKYQIAARMLRDGDEEVKDNVRNFCKAVSRLLDVAPNY